VAALREAPAGLLAAAAEHPSAPVRRTVAQNPSAEAEVLARMGEGAREDILLRWLLLRHPATPGELRAELARLPEF
jgi:hypothetical protein